MTYSWKNDGNLSNMSDDDYYSQIILEMTIQIERDPNDKRAYFVRGNAYLDNIRSRDAVQTALKEEGLVA